MKKITLGDPIVRLESVDSTNSYAIQMLQLESVSEGTVILAVHQTGGRGQGTNKWVSDKGKNLLLSIILKPGFLPAFKQFYLSMAVSVGMQSYVADLGIPALIKWPNDILIHGKKVAGILIENTVLSKNLNTSVVGIGLNVNQLSFPASVPDSTSLSLETGQSLDLDDSLKRILTCIETSLNMLYQGNFGGIKSVYLNRLWKMNQVAAYADREGSFKGRIVDIAETGELVVLKTTGETVAYGYKEVEFK